MRSQFSSYSEKGVGSVHVIFHIQCNYASSRETPLGLEFDRSLDNTKDVLDILY
jgi:hypothetical protein